MRMVLGLVLLAVMTGVVYIRFAPVDIDRYHQALTPQEPGDYPATGMFTAVRQIATTPERILLVLDDVATSMQRTTRIAGSIADELITYESRSAILGFPDYTTVQITTSPSGKGPLLHITGRLRFGKFDMGVNKARVERWLAELGLLTVRP